MLILCFVCSGLAKAAVAGDERALDLFSAWRPRTAGQRFSLHPGEGDNLCFYVSAVSGEGQCRFFTELE